MRVLIAITALSLLVGAVLPASADDLGLPDYDAIRTPASPGFTLLGLSPTQVERPSTPKKVAIAVGGAISDGGSVEVAPYWLWPHPNTTFEQYRGRDVVTQLWQNVSLSFTSVPADTMSPDATLALGVRSSASISRVHIAACDAELDAMKTLAGAAVSNHPRFNEAMALPVDQQEAALRVLRQEMIDAKAQLPERQERCVVDGGVNARGLAIELAAATSFVFAGSDPAEGGAGASAAWLTLAYRWKQASVVATARGRREVDGDATQYVLEPGGRAIFTGGRFAGSAEIVGRVADDATYRVAAVAEVRVADDSWLSLSFGRDFGAGTDDGPLFTLANLKWGFGDPIVGRDPTVGSPTE